jgi:hypothetical protein
MSALFCYNENNRYAPWREADLEGFVMSKTLIIIVVIVLILVVGTIVRFMNSGPDLKQYVILKNPRISTMASQKMLVVELKGDPGATAGKAIGQLYGIFYRLKNNRIKQAAPRARWPVGLETKKEDWNGVYGLPVSDTVTELPVQKEGPTVKLDTWEYGTMAEILHIGPYSTETPTINRLKNFITENEYEISGDHEEEYLKGPGLFPTDPKKYYTIIRYPVRKK